MGNSSSKVDPPSTPTYQHIVVSGSPYERGYQHGVQAQSKVLFNINYYNKRSSAMPPADVRAFYIEKIYIPDITQHWPDGLEEMRGIADGAGVQLSDVVLLNSRYDLSRVARQMARDKKANGTDSPVEGATVAEGLDEAECTSMALIHHPLPQFPEPSGVNATQAAPRVFVAQNWDMSAWLLENDTIIVLESHDPEGDDVIRPRKVISLTEAGQLARSGMNSTGLALCANSLWSSQDIGSLHNQAVKTGVAEEDHPNGKINGKINGVNGETAQDPKPTVQKTYLPISLSRRMFLGCGILSSGLRALYTPSYHMSSNIVVGSHDGLAMDLEMTPDRHFILYPSAMVQSKQYKTELVTHANHFVSPAFTARDNIHCTYSGGSSLFRDTRLRTLLELRAQQRMQSYPDTDDALLGVEDLKAAFSDHASHPNSLCEHKVEDKGRFYGAPERDTVTVACVVYDVTNKVMHICKGNPCVGKWETHTLGEKVL